MKKVSTLVPCYNEEKTLPLLYQELRTLMDESIGYEWEVLFVYDGSKDETEIFLLKRLN
jgi:dolichol-phosphate mannosyltransferase